MTCYDRVLAQATQYEESKMETIPSITAVITLHIGGTVQGIV